MKTKLRTPVSTAHLKLAADAFETTSRLPAAHINEIWPVGTRVRCRIVRPGVKLVVTGGTVYKPAAGEMMFIRIDGSARNEKVPWQCICTEKTDS